MLIAVEQGRQGNRMFAYLVDIRPHHPVLDRQPHRWPHFQRLDVAANTDKVLAQALLQAFDQPFALFETFTDDHQLGVVRVLQLLIQRQVEANRTLADVGTPALDVRIALERCLKPVHRLAGFLDRGVLRQVEVNENLRAVRRGEELVLHETHAEQRQHEQQNGADDGQPAMAHAPQQAVFERLADTAGLFIMRFDLGTEDVHAQHRRKYHGYHPGHQQGRSNHRKQRVGVFPRRTGVEAYRHEAGHGHQGTGEHRERRRGVGKGCSLLLGFAHFQARHHHLDSDHGIVHQQPQSNDQRPQGDPLHGDAAVLHEDEHHGQHQRNRAGHHQPGTYSEADEAHHQYDDDRLEQRAGEPAHGFFDHHRLVGYRVYANAHWQFGGDAFHFLVQVGTEDLNVAAGFHTDGKADGGLAVEAEHGRRWIDIATLDLGDVGQAEEAVIDSQVDRLEVFLGGELASGTHRNPLGPGFDDPGRGHRVLGLQGLQHLTLVDTEGRQFARGEVQVQHFILGADHLHLAQVGHLADLGTHLLDVVAQLSHAQTVGGKGIDRAEYITELIVERRPLDALGELAADVLDLLAHLVPDLRNVLGLGGVAQVDVDRRFTRAGVALHIVERIQFFELFLDAVSDLVEGFVLGRTRPAGLDNHGLDGERGVFFTPQVHVGEHAHQQADEHQVPDKGLVLQRPLRQVEASFHRGSSSSTLTFWPGFRLFTPAVTTRSPACTPALSTTL
ncbi:hypothetical protein D3C77_248060 [compost metagenome]